MRQCSRGNVIKENPYVALGVKSHLVGSRRGAKLNSTDSATWIAGRIYNQKTLSLHVCPDISITWALSFKWELEAIHKADIVKFKRSTSRLMFYDFQATSHNALLCQQRTSEPPIDDQNKCKFLFTYIYTSGLFDFIGHLSSIPQQIVLEVRKKAPLQTSLWSQMSASCRIVVSHTIVNTNYLLSVIDHQTYLMMAMFTTRRKLSQSIEV